MGLALGGVAQASIADCLFEGLARAEGVERLSIRIDRLVSAVEANGVADRDSGQLDEDEPQLLDCAQATAEAS